ncbi:MAG: helix-turn-helix domain-containing protein [Geitlerinemataceae cyanobacterium]|mgnify:CR=1 FL=1
MSSPGPELARKQVEVLTEMGAYLHERRLELQLTIEQVSTTTRIPVRLLVAIESGNLQELPEAVYTQGLLRRFADAVQLDGTEYSQKFPTGIDPTPRASAWQKSPAAQLRPLHLYFAYVAVVVAAVTGISLSFDRTQNPSADRSEDGVEETQPAPAPAAPTEPPAVAQQPDRNAQNANAASTTTDAATEAADAAPSAPSAQNSGEDGPVSVELTVTSESWLQVLADGEVAFEGTLSEGQQAWSADREITVVAGNAGAIMVTVNGSAEKEPLGQPGAVEEVTFMADSRNAPAAATP